MTREEAIKIIMHEFPFNPFEVEDINTACRMAVKALRAQQTPLDRSRWEGCEYCLNDKGIVTFEVPDDVEISEEDITFEWVKEPRYCPICGKPLTEEAWAELARLIGGNDGKTDTKN